tara:strand:- start:983 stop:1927 length:945 start_codon:yes stop_codon:yes gene_type:complete
MHLHIISSSDPTEFKTSHIASYRLRLSYVYEAAIQLGYKVTGNQNITNNANIYYISKVTKDMKKNISTIIQELKIRKSRILLDYTDDILSSKFDEDRKEIYQRLIKIDPILVVPVEGLGEKLKKIGKKVYVIPDGIDTISNIDPFHKRNLEKNILWHGHSSNINSLIRIISKELLEFKYNLHIVSNHVTFDILKQTRFLKTPKCKLIAHLWSPKQLEAVSKVCDFSILPTGKKWASANRLITNFVLGLPTIAETISSYKQFSNYYCDFENNNLIQMFDSPEKWHTKVRIAQKQIRNDFDHRSLINLWKKILKQN